MSTMICCRCHQGGKTYGMALHIWEARTGHDFTGHFYCPKCWAGFLAVQNLLGTSHLGPELKQEKAEAKEEEEP